ncbi:MAG TPA: hypothetical protein VH141_14330 [Pseudonocardia sp.]|nr:hypothetical protein [Pseudonocardia sp.]
MRRFVFTPRWVFGHVLAVIAVVSCLLLADWQWGRAEITHSLQNMAYAAQWPMFAVFFAVMWWRMLRLESQRLDEEAAELAEAGESGEADVEAAEPPARTRTERAAPVAEARPATDRSARAVITPDEDDDPELAAYNRMLAELAVRDREAEAARGR